MLHWRLGTMGFSYPDWVGPFYPPVLRPGDYLAYYARHFDTVELDTTFYATPPAGRVRRWGEAVPADFRFCAKAPREVTHDALPEAPDRAAGAMRHFLETMAAMGPKLAVVLLQFPPRFAAERGSALAALVESTRQSAGEVVPGVRFAVEVRDASWFVPPACDGLARLLGEAGWAWASADYALTPAFVRPTADFLYVRWIGQHERFHYLGEEQWDVTDRLAWWKQRLEEAGREQGGRERASAEPHESADRASPLPSPSPWPAATVWGMFNNDYAGYSVGTCNRFKGMLGLPARHGGDGQGRLFG